MPAYIRPLFCEGKGPFRWVALSGDPADIAATDRAVLEEFPDNDGPGPLDPPGRRTGWPSRACPPGSAGSGYGERARMGARFNDMVARRAGSPRPIVIGRDHLDCGSVASPYRETEAMADGSDAIADWPLLNAMVNVASGASWVSIHDGGGVGIGRSLHAGRSAWPTARPWPPPSSNGCSPTTRPWASSATSTPATSEARRGGRRRARLQRSRGAGKVVADDRPRLVATVGPSDPAGVGRPVGADELDTPEMQALIDDLIETMRYYHGAGLAAPPGHGLGAHRRHRGRTHNPRYPYKPDIPLDGRWSTRRSSALDDETFANNEGCLSVPGPARRDRPATSRSACGPSTATASPSSGEVRGLTAVTFQHEVDHLDGTLFVDRVEDPTTFTTWEQFERFHRDEFVGPRRRLVARFGS